MNYLPPSEPTRPHRRPDLDRTQPHQPVYPPGRYDPTQPNMSVRPPAVYPEPPRQPPSHFQKYSRRRRRVGCIGSIFRGFLAIGLFGVLFTGLLMLIYWLAPPPRANIMILGIDAREGEGVVTRTDTIILATVDADQPYVGMLSIPRDLYINIPGYGENRINAAHILAEGSIPGSGIEVTRQTIEQNFGVPVHHYIRVNFQAFVAIIDAAGGIEVDVPYHIIDYEYPTADYGVMTIEFQPGVQIMDGETALIYARTRHGSSDFERAERQQQVLSALMKRIASPTNWWRLPAVYVAFITNVDTDLTPLDALQLLPAVLFTGADNIDRQVLTRDMAVGTTLANGASVLMPNWDAINPLLDTMFRR